ncbi:MAG TPA: hypothetical protein VNC40_09870 [Gaiellaceae bacterium]|nr:hypothetical protein [Gaiellaceae bacterium]
MRCAATAGVRLVLLTDERGLPLGYTIVPANEKEYEPLPTRPATTADIGRERALASSRLVIESVVANLKGPMRLERHLAKHRPDSPSASPNAFSLSPSASCSTPSPAAPHAPFAAYDGR